MARPCAARGHARPGDDDLVFGLSGDPPAAGAVGPLRQCRRVVNHRCPAWLRVRRAGLEPLKPLRRRFAEARDPGRIDRGRYRKRTAGGRWRKCRWDPAALRNRVLPRGRVPARPQADVRVGKGRGIALGILVGALTVGSAVPHLVNGLGGLDWRVVIYATSVLTLAGGLVAGFAVGEGPLPFPRATFDPRQARLVFANRGVRLASLGYFGHMWELS